MRVPDALAREAFPEALLDVLRTLGAAGHRSWLVGGAVRDVLLGRPRAAGDLDVATPATPAQVTALFRKVIPTGAEHGTVTVVSRGVHVEVTTFRGEGAYADGRRPGSVTFLSELEEDLARRDFTINALAFDPLSGELRDPFGGQADLAARRLRAVGDPEARFAEDGLRPVRAVRFAAQLGYGLETPTRRAIPGALAVVRKVSRERIAVELSKLLVAPHAASGLALARRTGLDAVILPAFAALPPAERRHATRLVAGTPAELLPRLAALLHPLPPDAVERLLVDLRLPRRTALEAAALVRGHACRAGGRAGALPGTAEEARRWLSAAGPARAEVLLGLARAEARADGAAGRRGAPGPLAEVARLEGLVEQIRRDRPPLGAGDLALDGRAVMALLGAGPGPHVGEALRALLDRVLADPSANDPDRLAEALRAWWAGRNRSP